MIAHTAYSLWDRDRTRYTEFMIQYNSEDDIPRLIEAANERVAETRALGEGMPEEAWHKRPAEDSWSAAECISHLNTLSEKMLPKLREAIADAGDASVKSPGPYHYGLFEKLFVYLAGASEQRPRFRARAPGLYEPEHKPEVSELLDEFERLQGELIDTLNRVRGYDPSKLKAKSPAAAWLTLSVGQWLVLLISHQSRHISQARRALEAAG